MGSDMNKEMSLQRLRAIVEAYGAAAHRWPVEERDAALALVGSDPQARAMLDDALNLDLLLDQAPAIPAPSDMLVSRIMAARPRAVSREYLAPPRTSGATGFWRGLIRDIWPYGSPALPAGALAASIVLGVSLGLFSPASMVGLGNGSATASVNSDIGEQLVVLALAENTYPEEWQQ
tara:strand:- start:165174 stop:165704 length:531 start_codon:yes stop_codon:yes gene_type:complete